MPIPSRTDIHCTAAELECKGPTHAEVAVVHFTGSDGAESCILFRVGLTLAGRLAAQIVDMKSPRGRVHTMQAFTAQPVRPRAVKPSAKQLLSALEKCTQAVERGLPQGGNESTVAKECRALLTAAGHPMP